MRRSRELIEVVALIAAIVGVTALWTGSRADAKDEPKPHCPLCGNEEVSFENTPEGAFAKLRFALVAGSTTLLLEATTGIPEEEITRLEKKQGDISLRECGELKSCKVDGDKAVLVVTSGKGKDREVQALKVEGIWRIDFSFKTAEDRNRDCVNNLRQLGTYIVMYVSKFGSDRNYPGPGIKMFTDIFNLPTPEQALLRSGSEKILICPESGDRPDLDLIRKNDPSCTSYECVQETISDFKTQPAEMIAWDKKPCHDGKRNVLLFAGAVDTVTEEEFQELKAKQRTK